MSDTSTSVRSGQRCRGRRQIRRVVLCCVAMLENILAASVFVGDTVSKSLSIRHRVFALSCHFNGSLDLRAHSLTNPGTIWAQPNQPVVSVTSNS